MGHAPAGPVPAYRAGAHLPRRQHRGARADLIGRARLARFGESAAAEFLRRRGARVVARNVRVGRDEIDLVVRLRGTLVAVEVKTRAGSDPADAFSDEKARRIRRAAAGLRPPVHRVDLVAVEVGPAGVSLRWVPQAG